MRITLKEAKELLEQLPQDNIMATHLGKFIDSIENKPKEFVTINWQPGHEDFLAKLEQLIKEQNLEIHPKLKPILRLWIDSAINRSYRCIMLPELACPCKNPVDWGCPLLRRKQ